MTTDHYRQMIELSEKFSSEGLIILGFPCNQFLFQEPRGSDQIKKFAEGKGFVPPSMLLMEKANVVDGMTGPAQPVYAYLHEKTNTEISWNFGAYFLASKTGDVEGFSKVSPKKLADKIAALCEA
mmetsp:Transcript_116511/g.329538  ORF Transcript_116511/g.329538 Transcript_116511/m.329538 type:complete len:125 (+) Transcript_116511:210-584(+)